MAASSCGACLLAFFLFISTLLASVNPTLCNRTTIQSFSAAHDQYSHRVVNTMVTAKEDTAAPAMGFFHHAPTPPWSKPKVSWPLPKGAIIVGRLVTKTTSNNPPRVDNHASHAADREDTAAVSPTFVNSAPSNNGSGMEPTPLRQQELHRAHRRRHGRNSGSAPKPKTTRKPLCSYHRTASLLHDRVECSGVLVLMFAGSSLFVLICSLAAAGLLLRCVHRKRKGDVTDAAADPEDDGDPGRSGQAPRRPGLRRRRAPAVGPRRFSYSAVAAATGNFAECKRIGRGGFGSVYRGYLDDQDRHVAVKTFSSATGSPEQGRREFAAEVEVMSQLRHRNVVQLVGWCDDDGQQGLFIVYDLVRGGSLDKYLYHPEILMSWTQRYNIAVGLGAAILYLHTECDQCVVHGDIKPSNVMLDSSGNAKLGDFGLARLVDHGAEPQTTQVVAGTLGYIDPEFISDQKRSTESDIYSFGVVLLEIACGEPPAAAASGQRKKEEASTLLNRVRRMYGRNAVLDAADGRLGGAFDERQMERVLVTGLWCADRDRRGRPSIAQAMEILRSAGSELPVLAVPAVAQPRGRGEIRVLGERGYDDDSLTEKDEDGSTITSASTAYLSLEGSQNLHDQQPAATPPAPAADDSPPFSPPPPPPPQSIALPPADATGPRPPAPKSKAAVAAGSAAAGVTVLLVLAVWLVLSPPPGGPLAPHNHHPLELTPPPTTTTTTAAASSDYLSSAASGGSSSSKSQHDKPPRGQPVSLPAGEVLFRGAFEYGELAAATNGFSDSNLLGRGGFGDVYVGTVDGSPVAVKRLRAGSQQGDPEFQAELQIISRVHHRNLVSLVGYCVAEAGQRLLVYEFVPNLTLHHHLHGGVEAVLDWPIRWKIAFGAAKGLAYLHEDCHPRIIHRDIKAANILLDHDFNPKVSDFGTAKFIPKENTHIATRIVGTIGYLAPEYASSGKLTEKSDVFSFGVLLLELITGMNASMPSDPDMEDTLVGWARPLLTRALELGDYDELVDPLLSGYDVDQMSRLFRCAAAAVSTSARRRPRMSQIVRHLAGDASAEEIDACGVRSSLGEAGSTDGVDTSLQFRPMRYNEIRTSRRQARAGR
ncbi:hypothetical protein U9M48_014140 [Paspalum notatum var. saurae]|uniref:non-specific serine/threonine protein kinase n=1 Tax=Paspalum notatum var. saurae TaxID=547442 RepID=A0AAQ3WKE8_PASNO